MANRRTYTDDQLRTAVAGGRNWSDVLIALGKTPKHSREHIKLVAARLGLNTAHLDDHRRSRIPVTSSGPSLFTRPPTPGHRSSVAAAARWFMDRGYVASVPLDVASYDLVVESDAGLKRVQIKTTQTVDSYGRYAVGVRRHEYDRTLPSSAGGRRRQRAYRPDEVDLFFIITGIGDTYLIPFEAVGDRMMLSLDNKYINFKVA